MKKIVLKAKKENSNTNNIPTIVLNCIEVIEARGLQYLITKRYQKLTHFRPRSRRNI